MCKMLAVMLFVIWSIRRSDFELSTEGWRSGVVRRIEATNVSNCSLAAHRLKVNCSNRRASCTSPLGIVRR